MLVYAHKHIGASSCRSDACIRALQLRYASICLHTRITAAIRIYMLTYAHYSSDMHLDAYIRVCKHIGASAYRNAAIRIYMLTYALRYMLYYVVKHVVKPALKPVLTPVESSTARSKACY